MRQVKLLTNDGSTVRIFLEHWGSGLDHILRRWVLGEEYWECVDSREIAQESWSGDGQKASSAREPVPEPQEPKGDRVPEVPLDRSSEVPRYRARDTQTS